LKSKSSKMTGANDTKINEEVGKASVAMQDVGAEIANAAKGAGARVTNAASVLVNGKPEPTLGEKVVNGANELGKQIAEGADALATQASANYKVLVKEGEAKK
jgi:hypothetical protein